MKKINRTLLIGLGGAGKDIVTSVKRNYKESDSSLIEYLVIDTDSIGLNEGDLTRNEIVGKDSNQYRAPKHLNLDFQ